MGYHSEKSMMQRGNGVLLHGDFATKKSDAVFWIGLQHRPLPITDLISWLEIPSGMGNYACFVELIIWISQCVLFRGEGEERTAYNNQMFTYLAESPLNTMGLSFK